VLLAGDVVGEDVDLPLSKEAAPSKVEYFESGAVTGALIVVITDEPLHAVVVEKLRALPAHVISLRYADVPAVDGLSETLLAAVAFGEKAKGCDTTRLGVVSFGRLCGATISATQRNPSLVRALALVAPEAGTPRVRPEMVHPWPCLRTRIVAPVGSAAAMDIARALIFESCDTRRAIGRGEEAVSAACEMLRSVLGEVVEFRVPVIGSVKGDPFELDNANVAPRFVSALDRGGAHRTAGGIRYRVVVRRVVPPEGWPWELEIFAETPDATPVGTYAGSIRLTIGSRTIAYNIAPSAEGGAREELKGAIDGEDGTVAAVWEDGHLLLELDQKAWKLEGARMVVEFAPKEGGSVRLPATGAFQLRACSYALRRIDMRYWDR
jgi:hypothetical protein